MYVLSLLGGLDDARLPDANTLFNIGERLSGSFGIALLAAISAAGALGALGLRFCW